MAASGLAEIALIGIQATSYLPQGGPFSCTPATTQSSGYTTRLGHALREATSTGVAEANTSRSVALETGAPGVVMNSSGDTVGTAR